MNTINMKKIFWGALSLIVILTTPHFASADVLSSNVLPNEVMTETTSPQYLGSGLSGELISVTAKFNSTGNNIVQANLLCYTNGVYKSYYTGEGTTCFDGSTGIVSDVQNVSSSGMKEYTFTFPPGYNFNPSYTYGVSFGIGGYNTVTTIVSTYNTYGSDNLEENIWLDQMGKDRWFVINGISSTSTSPIVDTSSYRDKWFAMTPPAITNMGDLGYVISDSGKKITFTGSVNQDYNYMFAPTSIATNGGPSPFVLDSYQSYHGITSSRYTIAAFPLSSYPNFSARIGGNDQAGPYVFCANTANTPWAPTYQQMTSANPCISFQVIQTGGYDGAIFAPAVPFWSFVKNPPKGFLEIRKTYGTKIPGTQIDKSVDDVIKKVPTDWTLKVITITDSTGAFIEVDGYRWYEVVDITDNSTGWVGAKNLETGNEYLPYNSTLQPEQVATSTLYTTKDARAQVILKAVNSYYTAATSSSSLYAGAGGNGNNNFQKFIQGSSFPKEAILGIIAEESGSSAHEFNNEICSYALDGGVGIMQITSLEYKGLGSSLVNKEKNGDCNKKTLGWEGNLSKYYSNSLQGIFANIKDGFRVLQEKYISLVSYTMDTPCPSPDKIISGLTFTCQDREKILTIKNYHGLHDGYIGKIANHLANLSAYFPGVSYANNDQLIEKLRLANENNIVARLYSPATLQITDAHGKVSGIVSGVPRTEIFMSDYDPESEQTVIYFPDSIYTYKVTGTGSGTYKFTVDKTLNNVTQNFAAIDVPTVPGENDTYSIDWQALSRGEKGVTIQIDKNGDGIPEQTLLSGSIFSDTEAPSTTSSIIGTIGLNNWYTSAATISLATTDNVGIQKTMYSIDGGTTWNTYSTSTPLVIATEGTTTLQYYSVDNSGNSETPKTLILNIDTVAPTIFASDTSAEQISENGTFLMIPVTVEDNIDPQPTFTTDAPLLQVFAPGVTNIHLTAQDMAGNIATSSIAVTIYSSPEADPDQDGVPNQDDVKPFDATVFANLTIPTEYALWEKESFDLPFSVAGKGDVNLTLSNTYYRVGTSPVKDSSGAIVPATVTTTDGVIAVSFAQNTKELKTYTLTITTTKGNTKERDSIKKKRDHEGDEERRHELEKELDFASAPITLSITNATANKTTSQISTVNIYDKQQTAQLQYKYKDTDHSTSLLLKSDDVLKLKKGQPLEFTVKVTGIKKNVPFTSSIVGNFTMLSVVQEEEHDDDNDRKQTKFSLFYPLSIPSTQENIIITTTVNGINQTDVVGVRFEE